MPVFNTPYHKPAIFQPFVSLIAAESTRHGGVSPVPYAELNLGKSTGDLLENVLENRRIFCESLGIHWEDIAFSFQVHGNEVLVANQAGQYQGYDAIITNQPNVFVAVSIADCTPILIYDAKNQAVAAIHAGWRGTVSGIVAKSLQLMYANFGTQASNCFAYVGTCIDECSFEVGNEVAEHFADTFKRFDAAKQKYFVDLKAANQAQLLEFGIPADQIGVSPYSTIQHYEDYFSHRLQKGVTGRMMAVIGLKQQP